MRTLELGRDELVRAVPPTGTVDAAADADAAMPPVAAAADADADAEARAPRRPSRVACVDADDRDLLGAAVALLRPSSRAGSSSRSTEAGDLVEFEAARVGRIGRLDRDRAARDRLAEVEAGDRDAPT